MLVSSFSWAASPGYNCKITSQTEFGATTVSTLVVASDSSRRCLSIVNKGASAVLIQFNEALSSNNGLTLEPNTPWEPNTVPMNAIYAKSWPIGTSTITIYIGK